uniref:Uncharacterized protein n=1 Tax=viral metagenome TaxID=1070528 RepID=A0A6H1ZDX9_9ZZZZ
MKKFLAILLAMLLALSVAGMALAQTDTRSLEDNEALTLGYNDDAWIYHTGANSIWNEKTGDIYLQSDGTTILDVDALGVSVTGTLSSSGAFTAASLVVGSTGISAAEIGVLDGVTAGTVTATKAVVVDANKDIGDFRNLDAVNIDAGASGAAGTVDVFPTTASKGKVSITAADSAGDTTTTIVNASQAGARTYTIPDAGASASFVMTAGAQTIAGAKTFSSAVLTGANNGTAETGTTAAEYGDGYRHITVLTVNTTLPAIAGGADLAVGKLLYALPAGAVVVHSSHMDLAITQTQGNITADTPDGGLGTTIASGVVNVLSGTAAFENILTGQAFNDCNGTAEDKAAIPTGGTSLVIESGGDHTIYFNVADGWAASGDAAATLTGTVVIEWTHLGS